MEYTLAASYFGAILLVVTGLVMFCQQSTSLVRMRLPVTFSAAPNTPERCIQQVEPETPVAWSPSHTTQFRIPDEYLFEPVSQPASSSLATFGAEYASN
jgi:hypothetical protein